jgi:hypothetical protein
MKINCPVCAKSIDVPEAPPLDGSGEAADKPPAETRCPCCNAVLDAEELRGESAGGRKRRKGGCLMPAMSILVVGVGVLGLGLAWFNERVNEQADQALRELQLLTEEIQPEPVPDEENAAPIYRRAFVSFGVNPRTCGRFYHSLNRGRDLTIASDEVKDFLALNRPALKLMAKAAAKPDCQFVSDYSRGGRTRLPSLMGIRASTIVMMIDARRAAHEGRLAESAARVEQALHLARGAAKVRILIGAMIGGACEEIVLSDVNRILNTTTPDAAYLESVIRSLGEHLEARPRLVDCYRVERVTSMLSAMEVVARKRKSYYRRFDRNALYQFRRLSGGVLKDHRASREYWDRAEKAAAEELPRRLRLMRAIATDRRLNARMNRMRSPFGDAMPSVYASARSDATSIAQLRVARLGLGCELFKARCGAYPARLGQLVERFPALFESLPADPFTGKTMIYRKTAGGFVVYSLGAWSPGDQGGKNLFGNVLDPDVTFAVDPPAYKAHLTRRPRRRRWRFRRPPPVAMAPRRGR